MKNKVKIIINEKTIIADVPTKKFYSYFDKLLDIYSLQWLNNDKEEEEFLSLNKNIIRCIYEYIEKSDNSSFELHALSEYQFGQLEICFTFGNENNNYNLFVFHNVGQGLFYTGKINYFNFVYDCGAVSKSKNEKGNKVKALSDAIDNYKTEILENSKINFLAISHFDNDHVNGLTMLFGKTGIPRLIFFPLLPNIITEDPLIFHLFLILFEIDDEIAEILVNLYSKGKILDKKDDFYNFDDFQTGDTIIIKEDVKIKKGKWAFHFFSHNNFHDDNKLSTLIADFKKELNSNNLLIISDLTEKNISKIRSIYKEFTGNINSTSLIMLHYPLTPNTEKETNNSSSYKINSKNKQTLATHIIYPPIGTLLSGDINYHNTGTLPFEINCAISKSNLINKVCNIPHHGSFDEYVSLKTYINSVKADLIENYGEINPFGENNFPNSNTASDIRKHSNRVFKVNEKVFFSYSIYVD